MAGKAPEDPAAGEGHVQEGPPVLLSEGARHPLHQRRGGQRVEIDHWDSGGTEGTKPRRRKYEMKELSPLGSNSFPPKTKPGWENATIHDPPKTWKHLETLGSQQPQ